MPAESTRSAGEIRRLELVFTAYTLSIIARCWPEVQLVVPWRVRLQIALICFVPAYNLSDPGRVFKSAGEISLGF